MKKKKAIAYYRHSAEDKQENSVPIQRGHIEKFVKRHKIELIHEEADEGKSWLSANRPWFTALFENWILNPEAPVFDYILVYDVSRWGRFQDQDEAAYYEFQCRKRGKRVIYVSKWFPKEEDELILHLQTSIERYMAAEYSRQLSHKVFYGSVEISKKWYSAGWIAPYGMWRLLLDENRKPIRVLKHGEHKLISNQRIIFTPLGDSTTGVVKDVFSLFLEGNSLTQISEYLNQRNIKSYMGWEWNAAKIRRILTNTSYIWEKTYNKTSNKLKKWHVKNPKSTWVICKNAFPSIVTKKDFLKAQKLLFQRERETSLISIKNKLSDYIKSEQIDDVVWIIIWKKLFSGHYIFSIPKWYIWRDTIVGIWKNGVGSSYVLLSWEDFLYWNTCIMKQEEINQDYENVIQYLERPSNRE